MIRFALFAHSRDNEPKQRECSWEEFARELGPHHFDVPKKESCPMFSPVEFQPGKARTKKNAVRVWFGVLDLDLLTTEQVAFIAQRLEGLDAILYTTWNHSAAADKGLWKLRVCVRFSRPVEMLDWPTFWQAMAGYFGGLPDPQCKDVNRCYFGPFAPPANDPRIHHYAVFQGQPLDVDKIPSAVFAGFVTQGTERISRERLERQADRWRRSRDPYKAELGEALRKVCKGEPFAEEGGRDNLIYQLAQDLLRAWPNADTESLSILFAQSLQMMPGKEPITVEDVKAKLDRAQERIQTEALAEEQAVISERKLRIRQAFAHIEANREDPYHEEELREAAEACKCSREELRKRWLIQRGPLFYVLGPGAEYSTAYTEKDVTNAIVRDLAPAVSAGVDLWQDTQNGPIRKPLGALMAEYGSVATQYVLDMRIQKSEYDATQKLFIEAPCPLRRLTPAYDAEVSAWLEILTGRSFDDVQNWIAWLTDLDSTCAALLLTGAKDTGKSLFAFGLSRLWATSGPMTLQNALGNFNEALSRCPLVFADEQLPKDFRGNGRTAEIREFLGAHARPFTKKFYPESSILGAVRLIVAANNEEILSIREHLTGNDIDAIADRFYHVRVNPAAADFLRMCDARSFVQQDRIARHALYLRDHYPRRRDGRFIIKSPDREFYRGLATRAGIRSAVCQWFVGYLKAPQRLDSRRDYGVRIKGGHLCVQSPTVLDSWGLYVPNEDPPPAGLLANAIGELSLRRWNTTKPGGGSAHYRVIDPDHIRAWADQTEFASREEIDAALAVDTEDRMKVQGARILN